MDYLECRINNLVEIGNIVENLLGITHTKVIQKTERAFVVGGISLQDIKMPEKIAVVSGKTVKDVIGWFWDDQKEVMYIYTQEEITHRVTKKEPIELPHKSWT
ncbi:hypothetical protein JY98_03600 [Exiguobacterium mexicanum]|nr:hypothetical protein JY98_03600 [Exiguobacterium mexicanum]